MIKVRLALVAIAAGTILTSQSLTAGGSIGWDDARARIGRDDPAFLRWAEQSFDIRHVGDAMRVGRQRDGKPTVEGAQVGDRVPPFEFAARPKGSTGDFTLSLTFDYSGHEQANKPLWKVSIRRKLATE